MSSMHLHRQSERKLATTLNRKTSGLEKTAIREVGHGTTAIWRGSGFHRAPVFVANLGVNAAAAGAKLITVF